MMLIPVTVSRTDRKLVVAIAISHGSDMDDRHGIYDNNLMSGVRFAPTTSLM
jgi:hypothetical protein